MLVYVIWCHLNLCSCAMVTHIWFYSKLFLNVFEMRAVFCVEACLKAWSLLLQVCVCVSGCKGALVSVGAYVHSACVCVCVRVQAWVKVLACVHSVCAHICACMCVCITAHMEAQLHACTAHVWRSENNFRCWSSVIFHLFVDWPGTWVHRPG